MSESEKDILFNEILERYEKEIFNYCFQKLSHDKFMAEEVFDDVFMNLYKKWEHLVIGKDIRAYLYRTADILIKERLRKESRYYRFNYSLEESEEVNRNRPIIPRLAPRRPPQYNEL
jgi:DNA-directed RNA polymerase specialized sigma24 family protein